MRAIAAWRLSEAFARALGNGRHELEAGSLLGVEHEYFVIAGGVPMDFRDLIDDIEPAQHLDPGDYRARRLRSGAVLTCDETEAEIVLPPTPVAHGFASAIVAAARAERQALEARLPKGVTLSGYSTQLSVAVPGRACEQLIRVYMRTFAPALMLLMERSTSPGLIARPRPRRAELGAEFIDGVHLQAAAAFAVGSVLAVLAGSLPRELVVQVVPDDQRYGWKVDRDAFGCDLYGAGRRALLRLQRGGFVTAQDHLESCWQLARAALAGRVSASDLTAADDVVAGRSPLPIEGRAAREDVAPAPRGDTPGVFGAVVEPRHRPTFDLAAVLATWDTTVFLVAASDRQRRAFVTVPGTALATFIEQLETGELDETIERYLACGSRRRTLRSSRRARVPGLHDRLRRRRALLPRERDAVVAATS